MTLKFDGVIGFKLGLLKNLDLTVLQLKVVTSLSQQWACALPLSLVSYHSTSCNFFSYERVRVYPLHTVARKVDYT